MPSNSSLRRLEKEVSSFPPLDGSWDRITAEEGGADARHPFRYSRGGCLRDSTYGSTAMRRRFHALEAAPRCKTSSINGAHARNSSIRGLDSDKDSGRCSNRAVSTEVRVYISTLRGKFLRKKGNCLQLSNGDLLDR